MKNLFVKSLFVVLFTFLFAGSLAVVNAADDDEPEFMYPGKGFQFVADDDEPEFMYPTHAFSI